MVDLQKLAMRLDAEEKLKIRYRFPQQSGNDEGINWIEKTGKLLDVEEEGRLLFVSQGDSVVWVKAEETVEVLPDDGIYF